MRAGDVVLFPLVFENPRQGRFERAKFLVCVKPPALFLLINTRPPRHRSAGVQIGPEELPFLNHASFIDTGALVELNERAVRTWLDREPWRLRGSLSPLARDRVREAIATNGLLTGAQIRLVLESLR